MSLLTSKAPPAQLSIRSFFQAKSPKHAAPPPSSGSPGSRPPAAPTVAAPPPATHPKQSRSAPSSPPSAAHVPLPPPPANLPREACVRPVSDADAAALRRINTLLLPVSYPDSFYQGAACPDQSGRFSRVVTWAHDGEDPKVVGGVVCRVDPPAAGTTPRNLYIQSLCLLSPYRGLGLISAALEHVIATAVADPDLDVRTVTAHVWTQNDEGLHWYNRRGFHRQEPAIPGYYFKLRPDSAWLVQRPVGALVRASLPRSSASPAPPRPAGSGTAAAASGPDPASQPPQGPPPPPGRPSPTPSRAQSYQNQRPDIEWNDLPSDMAPGLLTLPRKIGSEPTSGASSRSSSTVCKKKDRSYPAAAFGN